MNIVLYVLTARRTKLILYCHRSNCLLTDLVSAKNEMEVVQVHRARIDNCRTRTQGAQNKKNS